MASVARADRATRAPVPPAGPETSVAAAAAVAAGRSDAVVFLGGTNTLTLLAGSNIQARVLGSGSSDTFALGGDTNSTFDLSKIVPTGSCGTGERYEDFGTLAKPGNSTWVVEIVQAVRTAW
jgi:autotransporter family porin